VSDARQPHTRDEICVAMSGSGTFVLTPFSVMFYGPEGGEPQYRIFSG
jgi:hypothetical protein